ncbi:MULTISPECIES: hypothetical protein [unclassified Pantoea]|uniref:hypothetical protein n=1 Tax=unclassified Pantoea TaxID=2630326 RepID=UPI001423BE3F|nr:MULTISPECIES: hypothetical protein [unclassified Pantoea]
MKIEIAQNEHDAGCKVIIDGHPVSFASLADAEAYVARLTERLQAAPQAFAPAPAEPA